jgi:hypothetical protein
VDAVDDLVAQLSEDLANHVIDQAALFEWVSNHAHPRSDIVRGS